MQHSKQVFTLFAIALAVYASAQEEDFIPEHGMYVQNQEEILVDAAATPKPAAKPATRKRTWTDPVRQVHAKTSKQVEMPSIASRVALIEANSRRRSNRRRHFTRRRRDKRQRCISCELREEEAEKNTKTEVTQKFYAYYAAKNERAYKAAEAACGGTPKNRYFDGGWHSKDGYGGTCKVLWQFKWTQRTLILPGSVWEKTQSSGAGKSSATTSTTELTVSYGVGVEAEAPLCGTTCGGIEAGITAEVSAAVSSSVESGSYTETSTKNDFFVPGNTALNADGQTKRVSSGYQMFSFSSNYKQQGWKNSDTTIAMPTFSTADGGWPEPKCFPGQFPKNFVVSSHANCRGEPGSPSPPFTIGTVTKGDYLCKEQLFQFPKLSPEIEAMQQKARDRSDIRTQAAACGAYDAFWKAVTGIQYNTGTFKYTVSRSVTNSESRETETSIGVAVGASVTAKAGGLTTTQSIQLSHSESKSMLKSWDATTSTGVVQDCAAAQYTKYGGHDIEGWQIFMWTLRGCGQDFPSQHVVCAPVVDGRVMMPECKPKTNFGVFHLHCEGSASWNSANVDCGVRRRRSFSSGARRRNYYNYGSNRRRYRGSLSRRRRRYTSRRRRRRL